MKRIFALLLALLMLTATLTACSDDGETEEEGGVDLTVSNNDLVYEAEGNYGDLFYYEYINGDEVSIVDYAGAQVLHEITVPAMIDNRPVTDIASDAFKAKTNLTGVTLPDSVVSIGDMAFYGCTALKKVTMPAELTSIGVCTFGNCVELASITVPAKVTEIGEAAFFGCSALTAIELPVGVEEIPARAFMNCDKLWQVTWSEQGTKIGENAFMGCTFLKKINLPATLEEIGDFAFAACGRLANITLGEKVTSIGLNAFYACTSITSATFTTQTDWVIVESLDEMDKAVAVSVSDAGSNAQALIKTYCNYYWVRVLPEEPTT